MSKPKLIQYFVWKFLWNSDQQHLIEITFDSTHGVEKKLIFVIILWKEKIIQNDLCLLELNLIYILRISWVLVAMKQIKFV